MRHLEFPGIPIHQDESFFTIRECPVPSSGSYYFLSNDVIRDQSFHLTRTDGVAFVGVANPHWFHALAVTAVRRGIAPARLVAFDSNPEQLRHFNRIRLLILESSDRLTYLERLFFVRFGAEARGLLANFRHKSRRTVHGGLPKDSLLEFERRLWSGCEHDSEGFRTEYGLEARATDRGLLIQSETIGDINVYYATIACGSRADYDHWPFTASFGSGFLASEEAFLALRRILQETPTYAILGDAAELVESLILAQRYQPIWLWMSNLLCDHFVEKHPPLGRLRGRIQELGTQSKTLPELDLWLHQDRRMSVWMNWKVNDWGVHHRPWSIHTESFHRIARCLEGTSCLEVVNVERWVEEDHGQSKLPNTEYCLLERFAAQDYQQRHSSILLHILVGHGMARDDFYTLIEAARRLTDNLVILEHNAKSRDFAGMGLGLHLEELIEVHGPPSSVDYAPGVRSRDRNWIACYRGAADH